ncbi:hypothetical protein ACFPM0_17280 [Pseudonocardia sulfidoxydans]|uniref:hypothetical protein n=1 Tax=Pseudonocardia sulfidoxydans TaxID=54011 RepID=UPI00361863C8
MAPERHLSVVRHNQRSLVDHPPASGSARFCPPAPPQPCSLSAPPPLINVCGGPAMYPSLSSLSWRS